MTEQTARKFTEATVASSFSLEQRFRAAAGTYDLVYDTTIAKIQSGMDDQQSSETFTLLLNAFKLCEQRFNEMVTSHPHGALFDEYCAEATKFAHHIKKLLAKKEFHAKSGTLRSIDPLGTPKLRNEALAFLRRLIPLELKIVELGYRTIDLNAFLENVRDMRTMPRNIWGFLFVRREEGEDVQKYFRQMRDSKSFKTSR